MILKGYTQKIYLILLEFQKKDISNGIFFSFIVKTISPISFVIL